MSLIHRKITLTLDYVGQDVAKLSGARMSVNCAISGGAGLATAQIRIFGLTLSRMNQFSTVGLLPTAFRQNIVTIEAGDDISGMAKIFEGTIQDAWVDFQAAPEVSFNISALGGLSEALMNIPGSSFPGSVDAAVVLKGLADQMGLTFENNGVSVMLSKPTYPGSALAQARSCADAANINMVVDKGVLAIWPKSGFRAGSSELVSGETGMIGYPSFTSTGIMVATRFNPRIEFGRLVQIQSTVQQGNSEHGVNGTWNVVTLVHDIESEVPAGKWMTHLQLAAPGYTVVAQ